MAIINKLIILTNVNVALKVKNKKTILTGKIIQVSREDIVRENIQQNVIDRASK